MSRKKTIYKTRKETVIKYYEYWKNDHGIVIQINLRDLSIKKDSIYNLRNTITIEYDELKAILFRLNQIRHEIQLNGDIMIKKQEYIKTKLKN